MRILIAYEKGEPDYYAIPDDEALGRVALKLIEERYNEFYYTTPNAVQEEIKRETRRLGWSAYSDRWLDLQAAANLTEEEIADLSEDAAATASDLRARHARVVSEVKSNLADEIAGADLLESVLQSRNPQDALRFLRNRSDYEYERITIVNAKEI